MSPHTRNDTVTILYTTGNDAHEWREWTVKLTDQEARLYRRSVRRKQDLLCVLKLDPVLERAEKEIMKHENLGRPPRVIFDDPNYPPEPPCFEHEFVRDEGPIMNRVRKMMLWYTEHGYEGYDEEEERAYWKSVFGNDKPAP